MLISAKEYPRPVHVKSLNIVALHRNSTSHHLIGDIIIIIRYIILIMYLIIITNIIEVPHR